MLWSKRYAPLPVGTHLLAPAPEDILVERERERVFIRAFVQQSFELV
ncbi:hypothetical protein L798_10797 [Zootermopsis nevadensis]|uniref:Uncharacterized protein n=1 Tax=Zootermopsis nevadensis TaxID=136037 RepID=A0A067RSY6_ZOONE|nr:hypothetical protein L798_10797 [Zootermopsis nevadensis]